MKKNIQQKVAEEINEIPKIVIIEGKKFKVKPLSFGQIIDASALVSQIKDVSPDDGEDIISANYSHVKDIELMVDIALIVLFRDPEERTEEMRKYLRENLTIENYIPLQEMYTERLDTGFFLSNIIFLKKYLNVTNPTKVTLPGQFGTEQ